MKGEKLKRYAFNVEGMPRQNVTLENDFVQALAFLSPNPTQWLTDTTSQFIKANGVESITKIVKCSIVAELLNAAKSKTKAKRSRLN
jgi:hypothetical protein